MQDELAWHLVEYLREDARLCSEVEMEVPPGPGHGPAFFTLDFVVEVPLADGGVRRVAFETASGRTLRDHERRLRRDATLLAHGAVDTVYRLRGSDLLYHMDDVLYLASQWERAADGASDLFSERGRINLKTLASAEARALAVRPEQPSVLVPYTLDPHDADEPPSASSGTWRTVRHRTSSSAASTVGSRASGGRTPSVRFRRWRWTARRIARRAKKGC